jgi:integrase
MTCYGAGLRISEAVALKVSNIDSSRMLLRIEEGKRTERPLRHVAPETSGRAPLLLACRPAQALSVPFLAPEPAPQLHLTIAGLPRRIRHVWTE